MAEAALYALTAEICSAKGKKGGASISSKADQPTERPQHPRIAITRKKGGGQLDTCRILRLSF